MGDLGGHPLIPYGWIFSAYLLAQIVGTVVAGQWVDRRGPALPATVAVGLVGAGLLLAALTPTRPTLITSRALQGLGAGALGNCVYASINPRYEPVRDPDPLATRPEAHTPPVRGHPGA